MEPLQAVGQAAVQQEWSHLLRICWIVLIPVGVLLAMVLYKLAMLLHSLLEFLYLVRHEVTPAMKDLRLTAENVEILSRTAVNGVKTIENGVAATSPALQSAKRRVVSSVQSFFGGLKQAFHRS